MVEGCFWELEADHPDRAPGDLAGGGSVDSETHAAYETVSKELLIPGSDRHVTRNELCDLLAEMNYDVEENNIVLADGFEDAFVGILVGRSGPDTPSVCYDSEKLTNYPKETIHQNMNILHRYINYNEAKITEELITEFVELYASHNEVGRIKTFNEIEDAFIGVVKLNNHNRDRETGVMAFSKSVTLACYDYNRALAIHTNNFYSDDEGSYESIEEAEEDAEEYFQRSSVDLSSDGWDPVFLLLPEIEIDGDVF